MGGGGETHTSKLRLVPVRLRCVMQEPHRDRRLHGQGIKDFRALTEFLRKTESEDGTYFLYKIHHFALVVHDWVPEFVVGQAFRPLVGACREGACVGMIGWDFSAEDEGLSFNHITF